jgi:hypothetical protein
MAQSNGDDSGGAADGGADRADQLTRLGKECLPLGLEAAEGQTEPVRWRKRKSR